MPDIKTPESIQEFPLALIKNMIMLATSGFGVVVALAWNEFIRNLVDNYVSPYLGNNSGLFSLFIYAALMTLLAVLVTMQLSSIEKKLENLTPATAAAKKKDTKKKKK